MGELRGTYDPSPQGQALARKIAPRARIFASPDEVFSDPAVRAVAIATPAEAHHRVAAAAIDRGRDVFVEKPLTVSLDDAHDLLKRAEDGGVILMVGHLITTPPS